MGAIEAARLAEALKPTHQLSIDDCGELVRRLPMIHADHHLHVCFSDTENATDKSAMQRSDVDQIVEWVSALPSTARLIVHCVTGESRSTAIVLGILARDLSPAQAVDTLEMIRPGSTPNNHIVRLFDEVLLLHGELLSASEQFSVSAWLESWKKTP
ncbi:MAG: hypothetical protein ABL901_17845 [Hyphomicrobiaceae bacterium]